MWTDLGNIEIVHIHMNVENGTEAAQFPEKEYINGIFLAVGLESQVVRDFGSCAVGVLLLWVVREGSWVIGCES